MVRRLLVALIAGLMAPSTALAADYTGPRAQWMTWQEAEAKVPGPNGDIRLRSGHCPDTGAAGCADIEGGELWLAHKGRFLAAHERAHFFDARNLDGWERGQLQSLMGLPADLPWEKRRDLLQECGVDECPSEMFADAYANCALGRSPAGKRRKGGRIVGGWESPYGYAPSRQEHAAVCASIREYA